MTQRSSVASSIVKELLTKFPDAPSLTLAKKVFLEHSTLWPNVEACRKMFRYYLGLSGSDDRKKLKDKTFVREPREPGWKDVIPEALVQLNDWKSIQIDGSQIVLILPDIHVPFHDVEALELALEHGEKEKPSIILLNGDIVDHYAISRFEKNPEFRNFPEEVASTVYFLSGLRKRFPKTRIIFKEGNHEERYSLYMRMKAPELLGISKFELSNVYDFDKHGIELVNQKKPIRLGKLNVIHGHEYTFNISNPVNPARGFYLRAKTHVLGSHLHQASHHSEKNLEGDMVCAWSTGCLCDLHPEYKPLNPWGHGFAVVYLEENGQFHVENLTITRGRVW